ncbi:MAG TPA: translocation/assembly module TamB domain-containing protein, partial [Alphaproteobacteria bacterium]|nr:translocation/assembly module TamB domain-containing protein [Alphaproteobacteria bacterium]
PLRAIANFFINNHAAQILSGRATGLDMRLYALGVEPEAPVDYHLGGGVSIDGASMRLVGLGPPVHDLSARLQLVDDQLFFQNLHAQIASLPLVATGSIFDFAAPQFRIGVSAHGDLANLRALFAFARDQDIEGAATIGVAVDGPAGSPRVQATVDAPHASYRGIVFDRLHARVAYGNSTVTLMPLEAHAQGADFIVRGALEIGDRVRSRLALHVAAPADTLPYAGELIGSEPLVGDFMLDGEDTNFYGYGALQSARGLARIAAVAHADPGGELDVAPLWIAGGHGTLYAGYHLDRAHDASSFWIRAQHLALRTPARTSFLGVALPVMPQLDGTIEDASIIGGGPSGQHTLLAGSVRARATTIAGVRLDSLYARFAGTLANAAIDPLGASGPWGTLAGSGALSLNTIAVRGSYRGTLQGLRPFMGDLPASGEVAGTASIALGSQGIIVQADNLRLRNANVRGIPISSATGTLAIRGGALRVESARAQVAGGSVIAAGAYDRGISLVAAHLNGARLRALGVPLDGGAVDADGTLAAGSPLPTFRGGVVLSGGRVQHYAVAGSGLVSMHGDGAQLDHVVGGIDGIYAVASGALGALTSGTPQYQVKADVPAGDLKTAIAALGIAGHYSEGTFDAALDVSGAGLDPRVKGPIAVPAGSINGLPYIDASGIIAADRTGVILRDGAVTVGSTQLNFNAAENPRVSALQLHAQRTDLSDFNNFFDTGDTLDGNGSLRFDVISQAHRISSNGNIAIAHFRYRNLPIGDTTALWSSAHNVVHGSLDVNGAQGSLQSHGTVAVANENDFLHVLRDSKYAISAQVAQLDLSTWIAALGYPQVSVTGRLDGSGTIAGRYPTMQMHATASLEHGTVWRLPIDSASGTFSSDGGRLVIDRFDLSAPGLQGSANGSLGFSRNDKLAVTLHASSNDLPELVAELWHVQIPVEGTFESTLSIGGSIANPTYEAAFDAKNAVLRGVPVPALYGALQLHGNDIVLHDAGATLTKGTIALAGSAPITLNPFGIGPPSKPISLDVEVKGVDPSTFDALVGNNTKLGGTIDGSLSISGTVAQPGITGKFSVAKGGYVSDFERTPITAIDASMTFDRTSASVDKLQARFGSGTVSGSGRVAFGSAGSYAIKLKAKGAQLDLPAYGSGAIDADLTLTRAAAHNALLSGTAQLSNATIPFAAFLAATQQSAQGGFPLPPLDLDVQMKAGKNVRVRGSGYGAGLDIGATGAVHLAGSFANPTLDGSFAATSGTLTYYDRAFRVQQAKVTFRPDEGIIPTLHATAETHISNPDPYSAYGSVDVTVAVNGPVTNPQVTFSSNPPGFSNDQILAMIAPFGGVLLGSVSAPGTPAAGPVSGSVTAGQEAFNILNAQFSAGLLSPLEGALSQSLGVQNVNLTLDYYGNVGFSASRFLGKTVNFLYAATFGIPQRTSFGLQLVGERSTTAQLSFYYTNGPQRLFETPVANGSSGNRLSVGLPLQGQQGFAFTLQRLFW